MRLTIRLVKITIAALILCYTETAYARVFNKREEARISYETDGHYWTVLVVATLLKIPDAKAIAYATEYPDNVLNADGNIVRSRYTFLYPKPQKKIHALTGGHPEYERLVSLNMLRVAQTADEKGIACHRVGDSFAHTNDRTGKMYPHLVAHLFQWKRPDKIKNNSNKYLNYVAQLIKGFGGKVEEVNLSVFEYIAKSGLTSRENAAILKAEYNLLTNSSEFNIRKENLFVVEKYLQERMKGLFYAVYSDSDKKDRETNTIILVKNTAFDYDRN